MKMLITAFHFSVKAQQGGLVVENNFTVNVSMKLSEQLKCGYQIHLSIY